MLWVSVLDFIMEHLCQAASIAVNLLIGCADSGRICQPAVFISGQPSETILRIMYMIGTREVRFSLLVQAKKPDSRVAQAVLQTP